MSDVTRILSAIEEGHPQAAEELLPLVYGELRRLAATMLMQEKPGQTLQATALVHEAWLKLSGGSPSWHNRRHFFAAAAEGMRRILVDGARRKAAVKQGGEYLHDSLEAEIIAPVPSAEAMAVHDVLDRLALHDSISSDLVKLHYFGGFSLEEAGELLGLSRASAYRQWTYAKAWLRAALDEEIQN